MKRMRCVATGCCVPDEFACQGCCYLVATSNVRSRCVDYEGGARSIYGDAGAERKADIEERVERLTTAILAAGGRLERAIESADASEFLQWTETDVRVSPLKRDGAVVGYNVYGGEFCHSGEFLEWQPVNIVAVEVPDFAALNN